MLTAPEMERLAAGRQCEDQTLLREQAATSGTKAIRLEGSGVLRLRRARARALCHHVVIASAAKQSRNVSAERLWIASLRSQ
ncbi:hypothetical protein EAS62_29695 [Bradyrhizobium zhanjiangense]|uniref:Uncharacterized protein n=1 Tax=Bradyrhizobium zhanjiangense TaxID=1325107 RepID=A0ABY0DDA5_9BRAD|nr:hypothetical protein EAS62_29695 [Bradyrhizobium zhanjiangense]